jgi:hypothetical protein
MSWRAALVNWTARISSFGGLAAIGEADEFGAEEAGEQA